jgi:hypothetical protein
VIGSGARSGAIEGSDLFHPLRRLALPCAAVSISHLIFILF